MAGLKLSTVRRTIMVICGTERAQSRLRFANARKTKTGANVQRRRDLAHIHSHPSLHRRLALAAKPVGVVPHLFLQTASDRFGAKASITSSLFDEPQGRCVLRNYASY
jgi:hypothetical protein